MSRFGRVLSRRGGAALVSAGLLAGGVGLSALAPAAYAGTTTPTVHCVLPVGQGEGTGPQSMDVTLTPANAAPGTQVHAVVTLGAGPVNSTQTLSNIPTTPSIQLAMSGGATGNVTVTGPTVPISTTNGQPVIIPTYEGDFVLPNTAQGVVNFTPIQTNTKTVVLGGTYNTPCDVVSGATSIGSVNVQGPGSEQPTLTAPVGTVRPGYTLNFVGLGWPVGQTPTVDVCPTGGGACIPSAISNSTLAISSLGELGGTGTLPIAGIPDGSYTVTVTAGTKQASSTITVQAFVPTPGVRNATMTPVTGPVGTNVSITGSGWKPNSNVTVVAMDAAGNLTGSTNSAFTTPDGNVSAQYTITDAATTKVRVREGISSTNVAFMPFTVVTAPPTVAVSTQITHRNGVVNLSGAHWAPGATPTAALCDTAGNNCNAASLTNSTLSVNASGALSGSVTIGGSVAFNNYTVKVTAAGVSASAPITVQQRWISLSPDHGPLGTWVTITGKDYANCTWIKIYGINAAGQVTDDYSYAQADCAGNWVTWTKIQDPNTVALVASETFAPSKKAQASFTITP
ncbi:hypothetical protein GCM10023205_59840 [Yinghuangia aomiensis]|uniref:IPT/TIG domain-containing protein n=1 Tax=Yinghuangia aomiensis TaxID=676205 RepID=A0ABP9HYH3_9ACTN